METEQAPVIHQKHRPGFSKWPPLLLLAVFLVVFCWNGLTVRHWDSSPVRLVTAVLPIPAATLNGAIISYHDLLKRRDILVWSEGEEADEERSLAAALRVLIDQEAIRQIADTMDVKVDRAEIAAVREKLIGSMSDADYKKKIKEELNMSDRAFTRTVLEPLALAQALEAAILVSDEEQSEPKAEALGVLAALAAGEDFSDLAEAHSDDPSAANGGDIGYLTSATLPEGWDPLLSLPEGKFTNIMETEREFVIAKVAWLVGEEDATQIRTQAIIIRKRTVSQVLDDFMAESRLTTFIDLQE